MNICCTKKLQDELAIKPPALDAIAPLFSWHANLLRINRKKAVVLVNDVSRYNIVLYGLKAKDFSRLPELILQAIRETLLSEGVNPEIIDDYLNAAGAICFTKTNGAKPVAWLNKGCEAADICSEYLVDNVIIQIDIAKRMNRRIFIDMSAERPEHPHEVFYRLLGERFNKPVIRCKAVQLKATLLLDNFSVWREVTVPLRFTFDELHTVMQTLFSWANYHLHDFVILDKDEPVAHIVTEFDDFDAEYDEPVVLEQEIALEEYLPKYKQAVYRYDFGDGWEHLIEVQNILFDYDQTHAHCLAGEGDAPPEDVGGEGGYENFMEIMADPKHPEHAEMKEWVSGQYWHRPFELDAVNRQLKYSY